MRLVCARVFFPKTCHDNEWSVYLLFLCVESHEFNVYVVEMLTKNSDYEIVDTISIERGIRKIFQEIRICCYLISFKFPGCGGLSLSVSGEGGLPMFCTGSGKLVKVSKSSLEKAASVLKLDTPAQGNIVLI